MWCGELYLYYISQIKEGNIFKEILKIISLIVYFINIYLNSIYKRLEFIGKLVNLINAGVYEKLTWLI